LTIKEFGINKIINADELMIVSSRMCTNGIEYLMAFLELRKIKIKNAISVAISRTK
jgi:hypothetical protein